MSERRPPTAPPLQSRFWLAARYVGHYRWRYLGGFYTAPGFTSELMHLYLATELTAADEGGLHPDEDERLELYPTPFHDAIAMAERGEIRDAKSIVGLLWVARLRG
jgi:ADP-ribose pyrophosphatase